MMLIVLLEFSRIRHIPELYSRFSEFKQMINLAVC